MIFYTADLHFGHPHAITFDHRPFATVEEMDERLIQNWNSRVGEQDEVYILGDVCFRPRKSPAEYLCQLTGKKHLIVGNHDLPFLKRPDFLEQFLSVERLAYVKDGTHNVIVCHYPLAEWQGYYRGTYHVYGHIHHGLHSPAYLYLQQQERALNAGCMCNDYAPATLEEMIARKAAAQSGTAKNPPIPLPSER